MKACTALAFAVALFLGGCAPKKSGSVSINSSLERLVPSDTVFIAGAEIEKIRDTPAYQKYLVRMNLLRFDEFVKETGLDPRKDLSQILSCSNGKSALFMARGKFNTGELEPRLVAQGAQRIAYKGRTLLGDEQRSVVFLNASTAVAGPTAAVKTMIDDQEQPKHGLPPALKTKVDAIPANYQIWAALVGGIPGLDIGVPRNSNLGDVMQVFRGVETGTFGLDLRTGFDVDANATCKTANDAKHLHDALKGIIGLGRLSTPDNQPDLLKLYDAIKVSQQDREVRVTAQIAGDLVDKFLDLWIGRRRLR